jgi:hypothetical protein
MAARYGRRLQLRHVIDKLRCSGCQRSPATVTILDHAIDDEVPTWRIDLLT